MDEIQKDAAVPAPAASPGEEPAQIPQESLLDKVKTRIHFPTSFMSSILIPGAIVVIVLLIGGGGTYLIASSVLKSETPSATVSKISESNIPAVPSTSVPTPKPTLSSSSTPTPVPVLIPTPTSSANPTVGWIPYNFGTLYLNFSYPPTWFVNVANTSGAPYLTVTSFSGAAPAVTLGTYSIYIGRLEQVGITTLGALTTQLALNAANSTYVNGVNVGQVTVISATSTTVNGYQALERTVTYSSAPGTQQYELYILDGVSNVVVLIPQLDTVNGMPYFNTLVSTVQFTN